MTKITANLVLTERVLRSLDYSTQEYLSEWMQLAPLVEQYCALTEETLTQDQISSVFKAAQDVAQQSGDFLTKTGKVGQSAKVSASLAKQINDRLNKLARQAQDTGPIQGIDRAFVEAKKKLADSLGGDSSRVIATVDKLATAARGNPGKSAFLIGMLTVAAAVAGGPAGGAAVGFVLRAGRDILTGEKLSTAVGKSMKTAGIGALVGVALEPLGSMVSGALDSDVEQVRSQVTGDNLFKVEMTEITDGGKTWISEQPMLMRPEDYQQYQDIMAEVSTYNQQLQQLMDTMLPHGVPTNAAEQANWDQLLKWQEQISDFKDTELASFTNKITNPDYIASIQGAIDQQVDNSAIAVLQQNIGSVIQAVGQAVAQETASGKKQPTNNQVSDSVNYELAMLKRRSGIALTEAEQQAINEVSRQDIKKAAKAVGTELGQKITARKLQKLWKKAGSPTDSGEIVDLLKQVGLNSSAIQLISQKSTVKLPVPATSANSASSDSSDTAGNNSVAHIRQARKDLGYDDESDYDSQKEQPKLNQVTFPGTDINFEKGWVNADNLTAADSKVADVLDKVASGVEPSDLSMQELLAARRKLTR